jgi:hypothetical protein
MKWDIAFFIARCDICQKIKAEHQLPAGLLQPLKIPVWKWEEVGMDFITGIPRSKCGHDSIWVVVDRLTKVAHFIPVKTTYNGRDLADLYICRIVSLHGVPKTIVSDRGTQFISRLCKKLHEAMGTKLSFRTASHPRTGGQTERVNRYWKICSAHVSFLTEPSGKIVYPSQSSLTTIATKLVFKWPLSKPSMEESAEPLSTGPRQEKVKCLDPMFSEKQKSKSNSSVTT